MYTAYRITDDKVRVVVKGAPEALVHLVEWYLDANCERRKFDAKELFIDTIVSQSIA